MKHVQVVSESRAAFMYARESGELRVSDDLLTLPTLIVDAGSSTTDFTFVADLAEESLSACDFGESALGGGLLDRLLLEKNVDRCPEREALRGVFRRFPQYYARAELEARKVKEMFFTQQARGETSCAESGSRSTPASRRSRWTSPPRTRTCASCSPGRLRSWAAARLRRATSVRSGAPTSCSGIDCPTRCF